MRWKGACDGADALMLSGETSVGVNPALAVSTMARLIETTEQGFDGGRSPADLRAADMHFSGTPDAITAAAVRVAADVGARALVAFTQSGSTAFGGGLPGNFHWVRRSPFSPFPRTRELAS